MKKIISCVLTLLVTLTLLTNDFVSMADESNDFIVVEDTNPAVESVDQNDTESEENIMDTSLIENKNILDSNDEKIDESDESDQNTILSDEERKDSSESEVLDVENNDQTEDEDTNELSYLELNKIVGPYNIIAKGNMPVGTKLVVTKISNESAEQIVSESLGDDGEFNATVTFDIKLMNGKEEYQPVDENETINISITGVESNKNFDVYRITDDNSVTNMNASNDGNQVEFITEHFTVYTVGQTTLEGNDYYIVNVYVDNEMTNTYGMSKPSSGSTDAFGNGWADDFLKYLIDENDNTFLYLTNGTLKYYYDDDVQEWFYINDKSQEDNVYVSKNDIINMYFTSHDGMWCNMYYDLSDDDDDNIKETITFTTLNSNSIAGSVLNENHLSVTRESETSQWEVEYFDAPFYTNKNITKIKVEYVSFTDVRYMFSFAPSVESIDFVYCNFHDNNIIYLNNMFTDSKVLESITTDNYTKDSISKIKPTTMANMFSGCENLWSIDFLDKINTSNVTDMQWLFYHCYELDDPTIGSWDTSKVENMMYMFLEDSTLKTLDIANWDMSSVKNLNMAFLGCSSLTTLDTTNWNLNNVEDFYYTFKDCNNLQSLGNTKNWGLSAATTLQGTFENCKKLATLDVSNWDLSKVTNMYYTFAQCNALKELDTSNWNVSAVTNFERTFYACTNLTTLDVSNWDLSSVVTTAFMFNYCSKLQTLDTSNWNTGNITTMQNMFSYCSNLTELDVSNWDMSNVTDINTMFSNCSKLTSLGTDNVSKWNTSKFTNINTAFSGCQKLTELDVSNWDVSNCQYILAAFERCSSLTKLDVSNWNVTNKVISSYGYSRIFNGCSSIEELDLSNWDGSNQIVTTAMLADMSSLKVLKTPKSMKGTISLPKSMIDENTLEQFSATPENEAQSRTLIYGYKVIFMDGYDDSVIKTELVELPAPSIDELNGLFPTDTELPVHDNMEFIKWDYDETELTNEEESTDDVTITAIYGDVINTSYTVTLPASIELQETDTNYAADINVHVEGITKAQKLSIACAKSVTYKTNTSGARTLSGVIGFTLTNSETESTVTLYSNKDSDKSWAVWEQGTKKLTEHNTEYFEHNNDLTFNVQTVDKNCSLGKYEGTINFFFKEANW